MMEENEERKEWSDEKNEGENGKKEGWMDD